MSLEIDGYCFICKSFHQTQANEQWHPAFEIHDRGRSDLFISHNLHDSHERFVGFEGHRILGHNAGRFFSHALTLPFFARALGPDERAIGQSFVRIHPTLFVSPLYRRVE